MKKIALVATLCGVLPFVSHAQGERLNAATFSTFKSDPVVRQSGWIKLGDTQTTEYWYAHTAGNPSVVGIAVKAAIKAIGAGEYSSIQIATGFVNCSEVPKGLWPLHLHSYSIESNDAQTGDGDPANQIEPNAESITIPGGTYLAKAIKLSCIAVVSSK
ncbi:hypothetical protein [Rhodanobacter hydrolyticus]|uniref:Uncharacterized protein n=1 Tax=Rhodanobacter hydrolyticus TaxID=2250595 RepID=A0ABW8J3R5_9GAMM